MSPRLTDPRPVTLHVVPSTLRDISDDERRALAFSAGRDPLTDADARVAAFAALLLLLLFVGSALLR